MTVSLILLWLSAAPLFAAPRAIEPLTNPLRPPDTSSPHGGAGKVESRRPATLGLAYLLPPVSFGGASLVNWPR
ncbi:hypothetical protein SAMN05421783_11762 [Thiocapsa roseopersicina]|uniref:Uncharacterized protein n=1 Tax=Thiocapsa roseopersicina TaxID=1058 RepID=A0A1H2ZV48_THIRO|nr:hypothetical protein SAMN05421783_11762 [Thiocapsa roseopersicina]